VHALGLGHAEIRVGDTVITPTSDRLFALTFHLCLRAGEDIARDELVAMFWADDPPTKGRHSLRQMLYRLRKMGLPLNDAGDAVHLPEAAVWCDVREVLRDGWELDAPAEMVRAGGEHIIASTLEVSEDYRDWYDALEARVRSQVRRAALRHLSAARREGRWRDLEGWALQVLRHDALNEEATLALAESMVRPGRCSSWISISGNSGRQRTVSGCRRRCCGSGLWGEGLKPKLPQEPATTLWAEMQNFALRSDSLSDR
jgi:DNA-binding SARP family transcriptional activator